MIADQLAHRSAAEGLGGAIEAKPNAPTTIWALSFHYSRPAAVLHRARPWRSDWTAKAGCDGRYNEEKPCAQSTVLWWPSHRHGKARDMSV